MYIQFMYWCTCTCLSELNWMGVSNYMHFGTRHWEFKWDFIDAHLCNWNSIANSIVAIFVAIMRYTDHWRWYLCQVACGSTFNNSIIAMGFVCVPLWNEVEQ